MRKSKFKLEDYLQQQNLVRELCLSLGLKEQKNGYEYQFWTPGHPSIFGECVRLFDYDSHPADKVVFFYGLTEYDSFYHSYCFHSNMEVVKTNLNIDCITNHFNFPLSKTDLENLSKIIRADIEDAKRLTQQFLLDDIKKDF